MSFCWFGRARLNHHAAFEIGKLVHSYRLHAQQHRPMTTITRTTATLPIIMTYCISLSCTPLSTRRKKEKKTRLMKACLIFSHIWATSWENLFMQYANNKGADQPAHPRSLISAFIVRWLDSTIPILAKSEISRLQLASVAEQAGLSLT